MNNELYHFGIKGMHWGVRRASKKQLNSAKQITTESSKAIDAVREAKNRERNNRPKKSSKMDVSKISDAEMRAFINRKNMERQYRQLMDDEESRSKGRDYVSSAGNILTATLGVTTSALGIALAVKELKGGE